MALIRVVDFDPCPVCGGGGGGAPSDTLSVFSTPQGGSSDSAGVILDVSNFVSVEDEAGKEPPFALEAPYPNPARSAVVVPFALPEAAEVTLAVYDVLGRKVTVLARGHHEAGRHTAEWNTSGLASGVYLVRATFEAESIRTLSRRLTILD